MQHHDVFRPMHSGPICLGSSTFINPLTYISILQIPVHHYVVSKPIHSVACTSLQLILYVSNIVLFSIDYSIFRQMLMLRHDDLSLSQGKL